MLCLGGRVERLLGGSSASSASDGTTTSAGAGEPDVRALTALFFALYALMATQDVAVDGWALTLLSRRNVGLASTANAVGQTVGYFAAYTGYLALSEHGLATLAGFMRFWGVAFLLSAVAVALKREAPHPEGGASASVGSVYAHMWRLLRLRPVRTLLLVLLSCRVAFAATDGLLTLKLMQAGLSKARLGYLSAAIAPAQMALPLALARWTSGDDPWGAFLSAYPLRLAVGVASVALLAAAPPPGAPQAAFVAASGGVMAALALLSQAQFVAQMAFFARVSDPSIGGTAMTLLNTVANLGGKWPNSVILFAADGLTRRACDAGVSAGAAAALAAALPAGAAACATPAAREACAAAGGACVVRSDGFAALTLACSAAGVAWMLLMRARVRAMGALPPSAWLAAPHAASA
jgi:PAT family acetyl-CoA transporter-like MFS transporter 1